MKSKRLIAIVTTVAIVLQLRGLTASAIDKTYTINRLIGQTAIETSIQIAKEVNASKLQTVVVASETDLTNALSGTVLAAKFKAPILFVKPTAKSSQATLDYIKTKLASTGKVYILGRTTEVSTEIENTIKKLGFKDVKRLYGKTKEETLKSINNEVGASVGTPVFITPESVTNAIAVSGVAAIKGYPILVSGKSSLSQPTIDSLKSIKPSKVYLVGNTADLPESVVKQVVNIVGLKSSDIVRISVKDKYDASLQIAKYFSINTTTTLIASGEKPTDVLAGSSLALKRNAPVLLVSNTNINAQKQYLDSTNIKDLVILGGEGSVSKPAYNLLMKEVHNNQKHERVRLGALDEFDAAVQISTEFAKNNAIGGTHDFCDINGKWYKLPTDITNSFTKNESIKNCIIIGQNSYADAFSSTPLSVYLNAPILFSGKDVLNKDTQNQLSKLGIKNVYIVGGFDKVSATVEQRLKNLGYNITRYGGSNEVETNRLVMKSIPQSLWGAEPKIINKDDLVQGMSIAVDTKYNYREWLTNDPKDIKQIVYINPVFLLDGKSDTYKDLKEIGSLLQNTKTYWNGLMENSFRSWIDYHIFDEYLENIENTDEELAKAIDKEIANIFGYYRNLTTSMQYDKATLNNFALNQEFIQTISTQAYNYKVQSALLCSDREMGKIMPALALSAKYAMPIVFAGRPAPEILGFTPDGADIQYMFNRVYRNINKVYYIGDTTSIPDGSELILNGK